MCIWNGQSAAAVPEAAMTDGIICALATSFSCTQAAQYFRARKMCLEKNFLKEEAGD